MALRPQWEERQPHSHQRARGLRVNVVEDGEFVTTKCIGFDDKGRFKMSRKAILKEKDAAKIEETQET